MTIDIICPLYNAEKYIKNLHKSILKQENVKLNNIRYVLTEGKDNTEEILKKLDNCTYIVIEPKEFSHSLTREQEAYKSDADIIVFITQDVIIERTDWLYNLTKDIENGQVDACYSRQLCNNNSIEKYTRESNYPSKSKIVSKEDIKELGLKTFFFSDASSAIKRETFVKLNGYDGEKFVCLEIEVPDEQVLLSDFDLWSLILLDSIITETEEEDHKLTEIYKELTPQKQLEMKYKNWNRVFDVTPFENEWTRRGSWIQATFWVLTKDMIKKVRHFKAAC